jgi:hypothetical protein
MSLLSVESVIVSIIIFKPIKHEENINSFLFLVFLKPVKLPLHIKQSMIIQCEN